MRDVVYLWSRCEPTLLPSACPLAVTRDYLVGEGRLTPDLLHPKQ